MTTLREDELQLLVVDDDPAVRRLLSTVLEPLGTVEVAKDALEAWDHITARPPDVVVLDVMLPDVSGLSLLSRLRAHPTLGDVPVVLVTALDDPMERRTGTAAGADAYITKPFSPDVLTRIVQRVAANGRGVPPLRPRTPGDGLSPDEAAAPQR